MAMRGILGILFLLFLAWALGERRRSDDARRIPWRTVAAGLALQGLLALLLLRFSPASDALLLLNRVAFALQEATDQGTAFVFGYLGGAALPFTETSAGASFILAFKVLPLVLVISALAFQPGFVNPTERVAVSNNNGTAFAVDNPISNGAQANSVNPGTRIATDNAGNVYSIFGVGTRTATDGVHNVTYYLNRSRDGGVTWDFNGSSAIGGIIIDSGVSTQLCNSCTQASNNWFAGVNDLRGNITAIAPDKSGSHVYVLIGKRDGSGTDRVYLAAYQPVGTNLVKTSEIVISPAGERAALPAIAVKDDGTVVMMYETYGADGKVHVHVASSDDFGATISSDITEYSFTPLTLLQATGSSTSNREFGDYDFLMTLGDTFYGVFAGLGDVNAGGINTTGLIDPFFFFGTDTVPEPGTLSLLLTALGAAGWWGRRKVQAS
jgi:hypothetical protein